ncbi:uncharacterized protein LOC116853819 isoform X2 [Odontomachus brunneus]|uniref:uncharacterized protein LOC116853819 isoform X2 n=1 Tax=Odontomachus brunneus TaxID=486640 RepID=UPI0013F1AA80|nr:uncharacterized protein LOC116853819 isoform X2 [Odontomachus brunneus]
MVELKMIRKENQRDQSPKKVPFTRDTGTGSTNLLLTIPEEENISSYHKKQEARNFKSYTKKSCSSHIVAQKREPSSKQLLHITNGIDYNSSPEISTRRDDADGVIYVRPDPFIMHKILVMQKKVCELLDEIALRLENIPVPDGIKDLQKRQQCVAEFVVRFSRNYLYDLNRHVKDIQRHMCVISPRARVKPNKRSLGLHMHAIEHKLLAAHQLLLHALVAYCRHIPSSILKGHPGKFREILQVVVDLKTMCDRLHLNTNYLDSGDTDILTLGKNIERKCNAILLKLKLHSDNDLLLDSNKTSSIASFTSHSASNKKRINRKQLPNRLSMYSADTKVPKSNLKRRTNYYHQKDKKYNRIDIKKVSNKPVLVDRPYTSSVTLVPNENANEAGIRKHRTYTKEEDIKTMMDMMLLTDSDNGSNFELQESQDNATLTRRVPKTSRQFSDKLQDLEQSETLENIVKTTSTNNDDELLKRVTMITEEHLSNLVPVIADFISFVSNKQIGSEVRPVTTSSTKTLMEFLQAYQSPKNTKNKMNTGCDVCHSSTDRNCECKNMKTNRATSEMQNSGQNMRLVCISSVDNASKEPRYCDTSCQVNSESLKELPDFEMKMMETIWTRKADKDLFSNIELVVSEETEMNFLKYRHEYKRAMQLIPMYSSNTQNKPWDIVAWISDKLVDELITEIGKELEMHDVIQKLLELEFQEF